LEVKAADIKALRAKTGAGMLDCKNVLVESNGDFAKAEKKLKELGLAAASKRSGRATNEGRIFSLIDTQRAGLLELSCETDFVARNTDFIKMGKDILEIVVKQNLSESTDALQEMVTDAISKIKENITLKRFTTMQQDDNTLIVDYIHGEGKIGVLVQLKADKIVLDNPVVKDFAFDCALHIAAFNPLYLTKDSVDPGYISEQEEIFAKQAASLNKPENVTAGIVKGKLNKHLSEVVMLDQAFVKDEKRKVADVLTDIAKQVEGAIEIANFIYYRIGEEI
jgi:elongation factor Ts